MVHRNEKSPLADGESESSRNCLDIVSNDETNISTTDTSNNSLAEEVNPLQIVERNAESQNKISEENNNDPVDPIEATDVLILQRTIRNIKLMII